MVETDVCILGAGPVGTALARELAGGPRVCVLESGSLNQTENAQDPLHGEVTGGRYPPLDQTRSRGFGGTATIWTSEVARDAWGARYGPLQAVDFEARGDVPYSGWPFDRAHLEPYYERAAQICEIDPLWEDPGVWDEPPRAVPLPLGSAVGTRIVRYGFRSVFTQTSRDWASKTERVTFYLHARALEIETDDGGGQATRVLVGSGPGRSFYLAARLFVLALGGIENARLLLLSRGADGRGIGNGHDLVGRFFMDHPTATSMLLPAGPRTVTRMALYDIQRRGNRVGMGSLGLTDETLRSERLLNSGSILAPTTERELRALRSVTTLRSAVRARRLPDHFSKELRNLVLGADAIAAAGYRRLVEKRPVLEVTTRLWPTTRLLNTLDIGHISGWSRLPFAGWRFRSFGVFQVIEQAPEPGRRITLSSAKDDFGQPLACLHWFITERELESMRRTQEILADAFAQSGIGRLVTTADLVQGDPLERVFPTAYHHLGTTRMHPDPRQGVVDKDSRIHRMANLFVTGTSVFPTGGYINPTLTAVALAVRLAEHVKLVLRSLPESASTS